MAHFAELDENNIVLRVVVVDDAHEADGESWCSAFFGTNSWKQTSFNTRGGVHYASNSDTPDDGTAFRKNYAGIGYTYDPVRDAFIPPKVYPSFVFDEDSCTWVPPTPRPDDGSVYGWNEDTQSWEAA